MNEGVEIGIFGGSGFYDLLEKPKALEIKTPYGYPSDKVTIGTYDGQQIAFLPRHGKNHQYPPHRIPYLANLFAFKKLGVRRIIAPCAAGSLQPHIRPGDFVICDQFIDRTHGREDSFFQGLDSKERFSEARVAHISAARPYCSQLRELAGYCCEKLQFDFHDKGVVLVIQGPRFASGAESRWYKIQGWEVINMTQYPEVILARELGMCYVNISLITDYDAGLEGDPNIKPVSIDEVLKVFKQNNEKVKQLIFEMIKSMPENFSCECREALKNAVLG